MDIHLAYPSGTLDPSRTFIQNTLPWGWVQESVRLAYFKVGWTSLMKLTFEADTPSGHPR